MTDRAPIDILDAARKIASTTPGIDPTIFCLLNQAETRLHNGSETIGEYQRLTKTDYPGTLAAQIANGKIEIHKQAQRSIVGFRYVVGGAS